MLLVIAFALASATSTVTIAHQTLDVLKQTNTLRQTFTREKATEDEAAAIHKEVERALEQELSQQKAKNTQITENIEVLERRAARDKTAEQLRSLKQLMGRLQIRIQTRLEALRPIVLPGSLKPTTSTTPSSALLLFSLAIDHLTTAQERATQIGLELVTGLLRKSGTNDIPMSAHLLRLGHHIGWWQSLDGTKGGTATIENNQLVFHPASSPETTHAIHQAIAIHRERAEPLWVNLPIPSATRELLP